MDNQISIDIRVRANASKSKVSGAVAERLLVFVQAPAVDGKANQAVIKELAKAFGVRARDVSIIKGEISRDKSVVITGERNALATIASLLAKG